MFKPGQSGNPGGQPKGTRENRLKVAKALDDKFTESGRDELIDALVAGVRSGDAVCIKLACEYRWGKPMQAIDLSSSDGSLAGVRIDLTGISAELFRELQEKALKKREGE